MESQKTINLLDSTTNQLINKLLLEQITGLK